MKKRISKLLVMMLSITMIAMPLYSYGSSNVLNVGQKSASKAEGAQISAKASASSTARMSATTLYEGKCGNIVFGDEDNVKYRFDSSGTLTIYGKGAMSNYYSDGSPWEENQWESKINRIIIQNGVTYIGRNAFRGCESLTDITISDSVTSICSSAFYGCSSLTNITIPDSVTRIDSFVFYGCSSLTDIIIPDTITDIGMGAFRGCNSLTDITIPDSVTRINADAFKGCSSLTNITIPSSVEFISTMTFDGCSSLTDITVPDSVTAIANAAFRGCSSLTNITIPDSMTSIGDSAFSNCSKLNKVFYSGSEEQWQSINIGSSNECLLNADIDFSGESIEPEDPDNGGDLGELDPEEPDNGEIDPEEPEDPDNGEIDPEDPEDPDVGQEDGSYDLSNAGIEVDDAVYTGSPRTPEVVVYDSDGEVIEPDNYNLIFENNINAGMATVTAVADNDAYTGSVSETFEIEKRSISNAQIKGVSGKTYTGRSLNPNLTVKVSGRTLKRGKDYTISYKNNNKLGAAKATIKGRGNYTDSVTKSFLIKPAKASIVQLKNKHKQMTVSAREQRGATWYQVRYQTKGDSGKTVKSAKRTIVVKSLKSGKFYTVQVRVCKTVNGKSYWGAYSRTMKVRVK